MDTEKILISVHLPKTAGSSVKEVLRVAFGNGLREDYGDFPINTAPFARKSNALLKMASNAFHPIHDAKCIHGHFLPLKYLSLGLGRRAAFVTWVRDPVERIVSHYYYWLRTGRAETALPLHRKVIEEAWSLERFCLSSELRNLYSQFLWGFPLSMLSFVGLVEYFDDDFRYFCNRYLGRDVPPIRVNVNDARTGDLYQVDPALRLEIEAFHAKDVNLYNWALSKRGRRPISTAAVP